MELREMIESAAKIAGSQAALAKVIGVHPNDLSAAKAGKRGLPVEACGKLGDILGIDKWTVVAASALVTEKNPEKRAYLTPFVLASARKAAAWLIATASAATIATVAPTESYANDTMEVSSHAEKPAQQGFAAGAYDVVPIMRTVKSHYKSGYLPLRHCQILRWPVRCLTASSNPPRTATC